MKRALTGTLLLAVLWHIPATQAVVGFDCSGAHLNITTLSLLDIGECGYQPTPINSTSVNIQLLQTSEYSNTHVMQCKVDISRTIYYCGMHSHVSVIRHGRADYILDISEHKCLMLHNDGSLTLGNGIMITDVRVNATTSRSVTLAGSLTDNGSCTGTQYSDSFGTWENVIVQASVKITLKEAYVPVRLEENKIILRSGTTCKFSDGHCIDVDEGMTFWSPVPPSKCNFENYDVLYDGLATKLNDANHENPVVYTLQSENVVFALTQTAETQICGYRLIRTEHPRLYIIEGTSQLPIRPVQVENLDIFTYVNSKFVYVERHIRTQLNTLYEDILTHRCNLERQVLQNSITLAAQSPDEFAYNIMKTPGYMAVAAGEVVHLIKCLPVEVQVRRTNICYTELPVTHGNHSYFLSPKSRILLKNGSVRECNSIVPTMYFINDQWVKFLPSPVGSTPPQQLKPQSTPTWHYTSPGMLATSGIYTTEDLENLRDHIMFARERPALLNTLARVATGKHSPGENDNSVFYNMLDENALNRIAESTSQKIWNGILTFGSVSSAFIAMYVIYQVIITLINTIVRGYTLHDVFGCTAHLCCALSSGITAVLLYKRKTTPNNYNNDTTSTYQGQRHNTPSPQIDDVAITIPPSHEEPLPAPETRYVKQASSTLPRISHRRQPSTSNALRQQLHQSACRLERITEDIHEAIADSSMIPAASSPPVKTTLL